MAEIICITFANGKTMIGQLVSDGNGSFFDKVRTGLLVRPCFIDINNKCQLIPYLLLSDSHVLSTNELTRLIDNMRAITIYRPRREVAEYYFNFVENDELYQRLILRWLPQGYDQEVADNGHVVMGNIIAIGGTALIEFE